VGRVGRRGVGGRGASQEGDESEKKRSWKMAAMAKGLAVVMPRESMMGGIQEWQWPLCHLARSQMLTSGLIRSRSSHKHFASQMVRQRAELRMQWSLPWDSCAVRAATVQALFCHGNPFKEQGPQCSKKQSERDIIIVIR